MIFNKFFDISRIFKVIDDNTIDVLAGHNGPYLDQETNVRNTSHLIVLISNLEYFDVFFDRKSIVRKLLELLTNKKNRPMSGSYFCRKNRDKDFANGLMGQAWVIEALTIGGSFIHDDKYLDEAYDLYSKIPFDEVASAWKTVNVDGSIYGFDMTYNHQLWFAAVSSALNKDDVQQNCLSFLQNCLDNLKLYQSGIIYHNSQVNYIYKLKNNSTLSKFYHNVEFLINRKKLLTKSAGYHTFNLYAFAILKQKYKDHPVWKHPKIDKIFSVTTTDYFWHLVDNSNYSWAYNPPAIELAYAYECFDIHVDRIPNLLQLTVDKTSINNELLTKLSVDKITSVARLYECSRIKYVQNLLKS